MIQTLRTPLRTLSGAQVYTSRGALLSCWLLPLPEVVPVYAAPAGNAPPFWPQALLTSAGFALRTSSGAKLLWGQIPLPAQVSPLPDPQATRTAQPRTLLTSAGAIVRTASGAPLLSFLPLPAVKFLISGITRNSVGTPLGGCAVALYLTRNDAIVDRTISDGSGSYSFATAGPSETYYVVAYLAGAPDVTGTTKNTLIGT